MEREKEKEMEKGVEWNGFFRVSLTLQVKHVEMLEKIAEIRRMDGNKSMVVRRLIEEEMEKLERKGESNV